MASVLSRMEFWNKLLGFIYRTWKLASIPKWRSWRPGTWLGLQEPLLHWQPQGDPQRPLYWDPELQKGPIDWSQASKSDCCSSQQRVCMESFVSSSSFLKSIVVHPNWGFIIFSVTCRSNVLLQIHSCHLLNEKPC